VVTHVRKLAKPLISVCRLTMFFPDVHHLTHPTNFVVPITTYCLPNSNIWHTVVPKKVASAAKRSTTN